MRKEITITIESGRDGGKSFHVTEMSASQVEKWAARALLVLMGGNGQMDAAVKNLSKTSSASALVSVGLGALSNVSWDKVEPLYDELLPQVQSCPMRTNPTPESRCARPMWTIMLRTLQLWCGFAVKC